MNPNEPQEQPNVTPEQAPVPEPTPAPQPEPTPEPVAAPVADPAPAPEAPFNPMSESPAMPVAPAPSPSPEMAAPSPKKPFPTKLAIIIGAVVVGLGLIGVLVMNLAGGGNLLTGKIALTTYDGEKYSISVPEGYEKSGTANASRWMGGESKESGISISTSSIGGIPKDRMKESVDKQVEQMKNGEASSSLKYSNVSSTETTLDSYPAYVIKADVEDDGDKGKIAVYYIYVSDEEYFIISMAAQSEDGALAATFDDIAKSFDRK